MSERSSILPQRPEDKKTVTSADILYHDSTQTPTARRLQFLFVGLVILMVLITIILSIYRGIKNSENGAMYFLLGLCLIGFAAIEIILVVFVRKEHLPQGKLWFLYFVGIIVILQSIFTDVLLFED